MPEILETNVKITADASSLKEEANESVDALERLQEKYKEVSAELSRAFANHGKAEYIASLTEQRNQLTKLINDIKSGARELNSIELGKILGDNIEISGTEQLTQNLRDTLSAQPPVQIPAELEIDDSKATEIDKTSSRLDNLKKKIDEIKQKWDNAFSGGSGLKQLSKFVLSLAGIKTVFSLISRSMSTYLSQNDALREKLNGIYYAIGSMLAPILEWIVNLFAKIVLYVNAFLKGLGFAGIQFKSVSTSAKKTQKAMEKVKTIIAGFDELNIFGKQATDQADAAANAIKDPFADVQVNQEWLDKLYQLGQKLRPVLEWIIQKCKEIWDWLWKHKELVLAIIAIIAGVLIAAKIGEIISKLKVIWDVLKTIGTAIFTFFTTPLGGVILIIGGLVAAVASFVDMWKNGWSLIGEIIKDIGIALVALGAIILGAPAAVAATVAGIAMVLSTLVIVIHEHWDEISAWLAEKWTQIKETAGVIWNAMKELISSINTAICEFVEAAFTALGEWLENTWNWIKDTAQTIWTALSDTVKNIVTQLGEALRNLWTNIKEVATQMWNNIKDILTSIMDGIKNFFINAWNVIKDSIISINNTIANTVSNIWNGIVRVIKGCINGILGFINGMIRGVVNGINAVINVLNKFHVDIPDWVPGLGGKRFGFDLSTINAPQIPLLAKGGIIKSPTLAMIGEYNNAGSNPEIVTPQNLLQDMLDNNNSKLVTSFAQMTQQVISAIEGVDMEVTIGDDTIAKSAARGNNSYKRMTGKSLITV